MTESWSYENRLIGSTAPSDHVYLTPDDYEFLTPYFAAIKQDSLNRTYDED